MLIAVDMYFYKLFEKAACLFEEHCPSPLSASKMKTL